MPSVRIGSVAPTSPVIAASLNYGCRYGVSVAKLSTAAAFTSRLSPQTKITSEDDWFDYRLEHDPRFLARIARARQNLRAGKGVALEDLDE
ncbi:MAG: hypothetical protein ACYDBJ_02165 [Aggregatilineales bacterium]